MMDLMDRLVRSLMHPDVAERTAAQGDLRSEPRAESPESRRGGQPVWALASESLARDSRARPPRAGAAAPSTVRSCGVRGHPVAVRVGCT